MFDYMIIGQVCLDINTDYDEEGFEPGVGTLNSRIEVFKALSEKIGREKVIWRFDPLILTKKLTPRRLLTKIYHVGNALKGYTDKLVFSRWKCNRSYRKRPYRTHWSRGGR